MDELVSIITPSFNTADYISETINSVLNQTYTNWEMIIVDDDSTDNTLDIVEPFLCDKRIKLFRNESNRGAAFSRNRALREANGKWIAFLDSDDLWLPEKLEKQIDFMTKNGLAFTYTAYEQMCPSSDSAKKCVFGPKKIGKVKMMLCNFIGCLTVIYDKEKIGLVQIEETLASKNDYAIWIKASSVCPCFFLNQVLAKYRVRGGSVSHKGLKKSFKNQYLLYRKGFNMSAFSSFFRASINSLFSIFKKMHYVRSIR